MPKRTKRKEDTHCNSLRCCPSCNGNTILLLVCFSMSLVTMVRILNAGSHVGSTMAWNTMDSGVPNVSNGRQLFKRSDPSSKGDAKNRSITPAPITNKTEVWALVTPPGLLGGYRNQVLRLFGLVLAAVKQESIKEATAGQSIPQMLLPSLLWSSHTAGPNGTRITRPVPMEDLFDIEHWNSRAEKNVLPKLIEKLPHAEQSDCWASDTIELQQSELVQSMLRNQPDFVPLLNHILEKPRFLLPIANVSLAFITGNAPELNPRRHDFSSHAKHCQYPIAYGGGGGRGQLWSNYMEFGRSRGSIPDPLEKEFLTALKPLPKWRRLARQCIQDGAGIGDVVDQYEDPFSHILALHPRVETEMMAHSCGAYMNKNLTSIFDDVKKFVETDTNLAHSISGIFVALHRAGASSKEGRPYYRFKQYVDDNIATLDRVLGNQFMAGQGLSIQLDAMNQQSRRLSVFECGESFVERYYESQSRAGEQVVNYGSILPSLLNFDVAVEAAVFVGMRSSSWSNSVMTTRYYLGKGDTNFEYTRERGIQPIENGGLPPAHQNCDGMKDPG